MKLAICQNCKSLDLWLGFPLITASIVADGSSTFVEF